MKSTKTIDYDIDIPEGVFKANITAHIDHDTGCHTMSNGDPGWPPETEVDWQANTVVEIDEDGVQTVIGHDHPSWGDIMAEIDERVNDEGFEF